MCTLAMLSLKKRGIVDENNIAVTGWSYGGYMTSWLIGHASFWKAAIAGAPVTNLIDQYNLPDGSSNVAGPGAIENPSARVYKWVIAPGTAIAMHTHRDHT